MAACRANHCLGNQLSATSAAVCHPHPLVPFPDRCATPSAWHWHIRTVPEDFCVTEIDTDGVRVPTTPDAARTYTHPLPIRISRKSETRGAAVAVGATDGDGGQVGGDPETSKGVGVDADVSVPSAADGAGDARSVAGKESKSILTCVAVKRNVNAAELTDTLNSRFFCRTAFAPARKDKRAITAQRVTVPLNGEMRRTSAPLNAFLAGDVGHFTLQDNTAGTGMHSYVWLLAPVVRTNGVGLHPGDLSGNAFRIVARAAEKPDDASATTEGSSWSRRTLPGEEDINRIRERASRVATSGFANYFGPQRFGGTAVESGEFNCEQLVGLHAARGDFEEAVACQFRYLPQSAADDPRATAVRDAFFRDGYRAAGAEVPSGGWFLGKLCEKLKRCDGDPEVALRIMPRKMRLIWLKALDSLVFNLALHRRLQRHGPALRAGDWVTERDYAAAMGSEAGGGKGNDRVATTPWGDLARYSVYRSGVRTVTAADLATGRLCFHDAVGALLGTDTYHVIEAPDAPADGMASIVRGVLRDIGITLDGFKGAITALRLDLTNDDGDAPPSTLFKPFEGGFRRLVVVPRALSATSVGTPQRPAVAADIELPSGTFATVCLREVLGAPAVSARDEEMASFRRRYYARS